MYLNHCYRVQYIPEEDNDSGLSEEELKEGLERRIKQAAEQLDTDLRKAWAPLLEQSNRKLPEPLVTRHPQISDVLVVSSVPPIDDLKPQDKDIGVVIVDRMCGEAVLKGADIFAKVYLNVLPLSFRARSILYFLCLFLSCLLISTTY